MRSFFLGIKFLVFFLIVSIAGQASAFPILVYDQSGVNQRARAAVTSLGLSYTVANASNFNTLLAAGPWDAVVVDAASTGPGGGAGDWTSLINYIVGGGNVVMSFWALETIPALASAFDVSVDSTLTSPQNVYVWDTTHAVFNSPNVVGDLTSFTDQWADDGDQLTPLSGATAIAGFTSSPSLTSGAIVIGNSGRTIYNGFVFDEANQSVPLIANEIQYVLNANTPATVPEPSSLVLALGGVVSAITAFGRRQKRRHQSA